MTMLGLKEYKQNLEKWRESMNKKISTPDWNQEHPRIIVQDHLTSQNNVILNLAKSKAGSLEYEQPGYFYDGEVGVRKDEH